MTDFASKHRHVKYFGVWAEETADEYGKAEAFHILVDAVARCVDEDMRKDDVYAALNYLEKSSTKVWIFQQFRLGLCQPDPVERCRKLRNHLGSIKALITST